MAEVRAAASGSSESGGEPTAFLAPQRDCRRVPSDRATPGAKTRATAAITGQSEFLIPLPATGFGAKTLSMIW